MYSFFFTHRLASYYSQLMIKMQRLCIKFDVSSYCTIADMQIWEINIAGYIHTASYTIMSQQKSL